MNSPFISVIIPTFNREKLVVQAIDSVLNQSYKFFEVIVVDDCSTDNSIKVLEQYGDKIILVKNDTNSYVGHARNLGVSHAKGEFLAFLDSDDLWMPDKLESQIHWMKINNYDISCTGFYVNNKSGDDLLKIERPYSNEIILKDILYGVYIAPGSTLVLKKDLFIIIGGYDITYRRLEDWDFLIKILIKFKKVGFFNEPKSKIFASNNYTLRNLNKMCIKMFLSNYKNVFYVKWNYIFILLAGVFFEVFAANLKAKKFLISFFYFLMFNILTFGYNPYFKIHGIKLRQYLKKIITSTIYSLFILV